MGVGVFFLRFRAAIFFLFSFDPWAFFRGGFWASRGGAGTGQVGFLAGPPMKSPTKFKCLHCNEIHSCEPRSRGRQRYCPASDCRRASKAESQRRWLSRPENENYFRGADHVGRVRQWRAEHPGYWRKKIPEPDGALQEISNSQAVEKEVIEPPEPRGALQEICFLQPALLVGLVSILTGYALQEDIASSVRSLLDRGEDILRTPPGSPCLPRHEKQTCFVPATPAPRAPPVQLDRSAPGARAAYPGALA